MNDDFQEFLAAYMECSLWSTEDDDGFHLDDANGIDDISMRTYHVMRDDCKKFYDANVDKIVNDPRQAGHDFWLSRNGHGSGFFGRDWGTDGDILQDAAEAFGEFDIYEEDGFVCH